MLLDGGSLNVDLKSVAGVTSWIALLTLRRQMPNLVLQTAQLLAYWKTKIQENRSSGLAGIQTVSLIYSIDLLWAYQFYGESKNFLAYHLYLHFAAFSLPVFLFIKLRERAPEQTPDEVPWFFQ